MSSLTAEGALHPSCTQVARRRSYTDYLALVVYLLLDALVKTPYVMTFTTHLNLRKKNIFNAFLILFEGGPFAIKNIVFYIRFLCLKTVSYGIVLKHFLNIPHPARFPRKFTFNGVICYECGSVTGRTWSRNIFSLKCC